jgi:thiamine biosynthesis lipoprotein
MAVDELRFGAMGSEVHIVAVDGRPSVGRRAIERLESRWSRFLPDSEVTRINRAGGRAVAVSAETRQLVRAAVTGWRTTGGAFDATVAAAMDANGSGGRPDPGGAGRAPGMAGIRVDDESGTVSCPRDVMLDPGGIGKGLAADLAVVALASSGVAGALVSVGGDVRVWGRPPRGTSWTVAVQDPFAPERDAAAVSLLDGGVATSSCLGRRWQLGGSPMHHLLDPLTGAPLDNGRVAATAVAGATWWAEVLTKAVLVRGRRAADVVRDDAVLLWTANGRCEPMGRAGALFAIDPHAVAHEQEVTW